MQLTLSRYGTVTLRLTLTSLPQHLNVYVDTLVHAGITPPHAEPLCLNSSSTQYLTIRWFASNSGQEV